MAHLRKQIRDQLAVELTGLPLTGSNVFTNRHRPVAASKVPFILVYTADEASEPSGGMGQQYNLMRTVAVVVEIIASAASALDDTLDGIAESVEAAIGYSRLGGLVKQVALSGTEYEYDAEASKDHGTLRLTYQALYFTRANDASAAQ